MTIDSVIEAFTTEHDLPPSFGLTARTVYWPLLSRLIASASSMSGPLFVGIHGCQGSGKSTLTDFLLYACQREHQVNAIGFSLDDFYLTRRERQYLSETVHPLLITRGVPGTHDISLLNQTLDQIVSAHWPVSIPVFNKAQDDRAPKAQWQQITQKPQIIFFEGWCVGTPSESQEALQQPVNALERNEDPDGSWRQFVNRQLEEQYQPLFQRLDQLIMLRAPSFSAVQQWREEQEKRLVAKLTREGRSVDAAMSPEQIARFIQHYQRLTEQSLSELPSRADVVIQLDNDRAVRSTTGLD
ncbi:hypothetical protein [Reinekea blandensis]|uniref:Kinase n=1 Tax=Reinekea blandensis MED297 TaxID=314283 RepID=A4BJH1_9GAMM|nr:hypothetical protein [Reinekea blandensis]EAR07743.1 hypothetical protein MED297_02050 [Reinekea sp. MED297] [Reinekea blandensis MED297]